MARVDSAVCNQSTASGMIPLQYGLALKAVFGRSLVCKACETDPADLELSAAAMHAVRDAADELLARAGDTEEQGRVVDTLQPTVRLALCMWMIDLSLGAHLAARAINASAQVRG